MFFWNKKSTHNSQPSINDLLTLDYFLRHSKYMCTCMYRSVNMRRRAAAMAILMIIIYAQRRHAFSRAPPLDWPYMHQMEKKKKKKKMSVHARPMCLIWYSLNILAQCLSAWMSLTITLHRRRRRCMFQINYTRQSNIIFEVRRRNFRMFTVYMYNYYSVY